MDKLFSTEKRVEILKEIIYSCSELSVNVIAKRLKLSKSFVSKYFDILVDYGILKKVKLKFVVQDIASVRGIKILLNLNKFDLKIFKKYKFVDSVGLYGSCAKGTNNNESDVDLWIKISRALSRDLAGLTAGLRKQCPDLNVLILTDKKISSLKKEDNLFYSSLYFGSIVLYGDINGIRI